MRRGVLHDVRNEADWRTRWTFGVGDRRVTLVLSVSPGNPWIGRSTVGGPPPGPARPPFTATCRNRLRHGVLEGLEKTAGRSVVLRFTDGQRLVAELLGPRANAILLDPDGRVVAVARRPGGAEERLAEGAPYRPPAAPTDRVDPLEAGAAELDAAFEAHAAGGPDRCRALARAWLGLSASTAALILDEAVRRGTTPGEVAGRLAADAASGATEPVIEASGNPLETPACEPLEPGTMRLLPWTPLAPPEPPLRRFSGEDALATASLFHQRRDRADELGRRRDSLRGLLEGQIKRSRRAVVAVSRDLAGFEDPDRYRRRGEALLAGLGRAVRVGDAVRVPDPYALEPREILIPVPPGRSLESAADEYFKRHRRARRGLDQARARAGILAQRIHELEGLRGSYGDPADRAALDELEEKMREAGLPVGLEAATRAGRAAAARSPRRRLEGVRLLVSSDGQTILVGKTGKDNHRLTFKLAAPDDFWFHALGVPGAHVVVRNEGNRARPSAATLREAAAAAAWYSEARRQGMADVQWTRRKCVRKLRGAPPGTVRVKRFETVRVRPATREGLPGTGGGPSRG